MRKNASRPSYRLRSAGRSGESRGEVSPSSAQNRRTSRDKGFSLGGATRRVQSVVLRRLFGLVLVAGLVGCTRSGKVDRAAFQGVVEIDEVTVAFELGGRVTGVTVKTGDAVKVGQPLATLDEALVRAAVLARESDIAATKAQQKLLEQGARSGDVRTLSSRVDAAKAVEQLARRNFERQRTLLEQGAVASASVEDLSSQLDRATAERQAAQASLENLQAGARSSELAQARARVGSAEAAMELENVRLSKLKLAAPTAGRVLDVHVSTGEVVGAGSAVVTLGKTQAPYVDVFVPQSRMGGIAIGRPASVRIDALKEPLSGKVTEVGRRTEFTPRYLFSDVERSNLVVRVRVAVEDPTERLIAGVPAFVTISGAP